MSIAKSEEMVSDAQLFRQVMGSFASGVVVVTAQTEAGPVGITCQSFTSLSVDPPLVLFCPSSTSWAWGQIRRAGAFCINVLGEGQQDLGLTFASRVVDKFAGVRFASSPTGSPVLEDAAAWIDCRLHAVHPGGDHDVVIGAVEAMDLDHSSRPLVYHRGVFGAFADS